MAYRDMREWIDLLNQGGGIKQVNGAKCELEIGAITELYYSSRFTHNSETKAALLFDNIPGYPAGYRVAAGAFSSYRQIALATGLEGQTRKSLLDQLRTKLNEYRPVKPVTVETGPVLDNVEEGDQVDLTRFPTPLWHELDGGRYIGTGSVTITRDPEEGWVNLGTYRVMLQDKNTLGFYVSPGKHALLHREKWFRSGKPCPVTVCLGQDPLLFLVASKEIKYGECEYDLAGWLKGQPIEVIMGQNGLPFPAGAEIVAEGYCYPDDLMNEGPFGEWTGYYSRASRQAPVVRVNRLMYRNNPIILGSPPSKPPNQISLFNDLTRSALIWNALDGAGIPGIKDICCLEAGGNRFFVVLSIEQRYPGHVKQAASIALQCHAAAYMGRYIVVVDDDIDASDPNDVLWAICTRSDPHRDIDIIRNCWTGPLDPIIPAEETGFSSRAIIDACIPFNRRGSFPKTAKISSELAEQTISKWGDFLSGN